MLYHTTFKVNDKYILIDHKNPIRILTDYLKYKSENTKLQIYQSYIERNNDIDVVVKSILTDSPAELNFKITREDICTLYMNEIYRINDYAEEKIIRIVKKIPRKAVPICKLIQSSIE